MENNNSKIILSEENNNSANESKSPILDGDSALYDTSLVPLAISDERPNYLDSEMIAKEYYNNFNFSRLSSEYGNMNLALGVTSANKKEGKTLVAGNMAVSLAKGYRQRTVLVDLNFLNPMLHKVFGSSLEPGLIEAMQTRTLRVSPTMVDDLYLLPAGDNSQYSPDIKDTVALREIIFTLKNEFDFVVVDMGSILPIENFPVHFFNEVDGLLNVIDAKNTKEEDLENIYKHIDEERFIGYIFNRYEEN